MTADLFGVEHADPRGFGSLESNSGGSDEWLTPRYITDSRRDPAQAEGVARLIAEAEERGAAKVRALLDPMLTALDRVIAQAPDDSLVADALTGVVEGVREVLALSEARP